jgi:hypothetical protein
MCRNCGIVHGVFGRTLARFFQEDQAALRDPDQDRAALEGPEGAR